VWVFPRLFEEISFLSFFLSFFPIESNTLKEEEEEEKENKHVADEEAVQRHRVRQLW
jgi:hypothetical protein